CSFLSPSALYDMNMNYRETAATALICAASFQIAHRAEGQSISDIPVRVSATVQTNAARITLSWPADSRATNYSLSRKLRDDTSWGATIHLAANATNYTDTNVTLGGAYEYGIFKDTSYNPYYGEGEIYV